MSEEPARERVDVQDRDPRNLRPELAAAWAKLWLFAQEIGSPIFLTEGRRSSARQRWLYEQGRVRPGPIVTRAKPGQSAHEAGADGLGRALDFAFRGPEPFGEAHPWSRIGAEAERLGLRWGGRWPHPDRPHLELPPS